MSGGGIIIQRSAVLLNAVTEPYVYEQLSNDDKDRVELIKAEAAVAHTQEDCDFLLCKLRETCGT